MNSAHEHETGVSRSACQGPWEWTRARRSASAIWASSLIAPRQHSLTRTASKVVLLIATLPPQTIVNRSVPRGSEAIELFAAARQAEVQRSSDGTIHR